MRYSVVSMRKLIMTLGLLMVATTTMRAQYDVSFSHYFDMEPSFNAASVGKESKININAAYAMDLVGFDNNPQTMYAAADAPFYFLKSYHGAGVQFMNDRLGVFTHQRLMLQYAFRLRMFGGNLGVGVAAGLLSEGYDGTKIDVEDSSDPALSSSELDGNALDLGVGLYYNYKSTWYVGASVQHVNAPKVNLGETNELQIDRTYYLTAGYNIKLRNPFLKIKASALGRTDGVGWRTDVTGRLVYTNEKKMMYGGVSYSPTNSVTFLIGGSVHGVVLGYSYELYTSAINPGNGSHELFMGYQIDIDLAKKGKNKHKSVRIL